MKKSKATYAPVLHSGVQVSVDGKIAKQRYAVVGITTVFEHPSNPRRGEVELIKESIETNSFYGAVYAQESSKRIIAGNHRWKAALQVGLKKIPVIFVDVDDATALRILLADNRTSDKATYDDGILLDILQQVSVGPGLAGTGYDGDDLTRLLVNNAPPPPDAPVIPEHSEGSSMVHKCPKCKYQWTSNVSLKVTQAKKKK